MHVTVVIPVFNEEENVEILYRELHEVFAPHEDAYELLFVDDGSRDRTFERLRTLTLNDAHVRVIRLRRNFGQTAAMQAGIDHAQGNVIVTLDGDLQNDPADIPLLLSRIEAGFDLVHGWRKWRKDAWLTRKLPSRVANWLISRVTGFPVHDLGCTLKAIRREFADELEMYGEMHRFIPILAHQRGAHCTEVVTHHRPRRFGKSKYGLSRTVRVFLDLITVKFFLNYLSSPMKLFGKLGLGCWMVAALALAGTVGMRLSAGVDMTGNPLLLLSVLSVMAGLQLLSLGILGELNARIYYLREDRRPYAVGCILQGEHPASQASQAA